MLGLVGRVPTAGIRVPGCDAWLSARLQLPVDADSGDASGSSYVWVPVIHLGDLDQVPGFRVGNPGCCGHWGRLNKQIEVLSHHLTLFLPLKYINAHF